MYKVTEVPPGLYIDEISIAHNAHLIAEKGVDEHGEKYPLFFEAFGEYKFPIYIYAVSISEIVFGKGEFAVRFPSVFFGTLTIPLVYLLTRELFSKKSKKGLKSISSIRNTQFAIPTISSILLAVSPWHLQFSRAGFEANVALFFFTSGAYLLVLYMRQRKVWTLLLFSAACAVTVYTYQAYRVISPLLLGAGYVFLIMDNSKLKKSIIISALLFAALLIPLTVFTFGEGGFARFAQTSTFSGQEDKSVLEKAVVYPALYLNNYIAHFSPDFLFNYGDRIGRHQPPGFGLLYKWTIPFILIGFYMVLRSKNHRMKKILITLLLISPAAAALAVPSPHSLRALPLVIPLTIVTAVGVHTVISWMNKKVVILGLLLIALFAMWESVYYFRLYYIHYPKVNILDWGGGKERIAQKAKEYQSQFEVIVAEEVFKDLNYYFQYYENDLQVQIVPNSWSKPDEWEDKKVLFIRADYKSEEKNQVIDKVRIDNTNNDVIAEFWKL